MKGRAVPDPLVIRLYDRVRHAYGVPAMPVIVADQIAAQIDALPDAPDWSPPAADYGCVAPPFRRTFVEAATESTPGEAILDGQWLRSRGGILQRGLAIYAYRLDRPGEVQHLTTFTRPLRKAWPTGARWVLAAWGYFWAQETGQLHTFTGPAFVHLDSTGAILDDMANIEVWEPRTPGTVLGIPDAAAGWRVVAEPAQARLIVNLLPFALKAISAMHRRCAATKTTPSESQQRQARHRHDGLTLHNYYTLQVKPTPTRDVADFRAIGTPARAQAREHVVRGHFRIYGEERPLFGKHAGTYWVGEHERGTGERIEKDYEVEP